MKNNVLFVQKVFQLLSSEEIMNLQRVLKEQTNQKHLFVVNVELPFQRNGNIQIIFLFYIEKKKIKIHRVLVNHLQVRMLTQTRVLVKHHQVRMLTQSTTTDNHGSMIKEI